MSGHREHGREGPKTEENNKTSPSFLCLGDATKMLYIDRHSQGGPLHPE